MAKKDRISELVKLLSHEGQKIVDSQLQNKNIRTVLTTCMTVTDGEYM